MPPLGVLDITCAIDEALQTTRCEALLGYRSTLWWTFFDLLKLPNLVADTARGDGGRIKVQQSNNYT
jgi:hypothetical protein